MGSPARRVIPIREQPTPSDDACSGAEAYALMVLGDSMQPEFADGDVIVVEPDGLAVDGSFVVANLNGEWMLRALRRKGGRWRLATLDGSDDVPLPDLGPVRGVVVQKSKPGRRQATKRYVE